MFGKTFVITPKLLWGSITVLAVLLSTASVVTWEIRKDVIESLKQQIEAYEKSQNWKLPETLEEIRKASKQLTLQLKDKQELEKLRVQVDDLSAKNQSTQIELKETQTKLTEATDTLSKLILKAQTVDLTEGETADLIENKETIGIQSVYPSRAVVTLFNSTKFLNIGDSVTYKFSNKECQVTLTKIHAKVVTFKHGCA